jgi:hypothetical protein
MTSNYSDSFSDVQDVQLSLSSCELYRVRMVKDLKIDKWYPFVLLYCTFDSSDVDKVETQFDISHLIYLHMSHHLFTWFPLSIQSIFKGDLAFPITNGEITCH